MSFSPKKPTTEPNPNPTLKKKRPPSWSDFWLKNTKPLKHVVFAMQLQSLASPTPTNDKDSKTKNITKTKDQTLISNFSNSDRTLLLSDELLLKILSTLPDTQKNHNFLVCKRWLNVQGRLVRSLKVLDWEFIESGRLIARFPNLTHVDLMNGCIITPHNSTLWLNHRVLSMQIDSGVLGFVPNWNICEQNLLPVDIVDRGLKALACACPNLRKLVVIGASELGLLSVAEECLTLQELELHKCNDNVLRGIAACENLQILKLVGNVGGLYSSLVSDIGLTILAQGSKRLVKLELSGCEGSFDGIKAIGQCCQMLEELTFSDHRMDDGWLSAISYCENLKTLRFLSCKKIDLHPGLDEFLGSCQALERLHLHKCQLRDKRSIRAMFKVCQGVREIVFQDCWGLDNDMFSFASICRKVKLLSLEGCSLLTTQGLESVLLTYNELQHLTVRSCKRIKDYEVSPALSTLFSGLKELKWRPDAKSLLAPSLVGTGMGRKGGKFFKKSQTLKLLSDDWHPHFDHTWMIHAATGNTVLR
ncbi:F-box protein At5g07670 [Ricinus communis]|uniref:Ubiquitin-protein ligase, putative n=1 Tax=Ricinus communis TaxID=3988 RepID=B9R9U5_RICCO|nr:F-box protein At5g07670 [Ricinus communis]EEF51572.1 ubiquitin-protein ligase, putative [Ricinus communis]|eukprot:XP_002510970.1 F-box protein At5g07670 [Ricinus communis]